MIVALKFIKMIGLPSYKFFLKKKQLFFQNFAYHAQLEALSLVAKLNENVRYYALKIGTGRIEKAGTKNTHQ